MGPGRSTPPSRFLLGPAPPRRPVCAPAAKAFSWYRRPALARRRAMSFSSWLRSFNSARPGRKHRFRPRVEGLEDRRLLSAGQLDPAFGTAGLVYTDIRGPAYV